MSLNKIKDNLEKIDQLAQEIESLSNEQTDLISVSRKLKQDLNDREKTKQEFSKINPKIVESKSKLAQIKQKISELYSQIQSDLQEEIENVV